MLSRILLVTACIAFNISVFGQGRFGLHTNKALRQESSEKTSIDLFVRGNPDDVKKAVERAKGTFKYGYGQYNSVTVPLKNLDSFLENPVIRGVQNGEIPMTALSDTAIIVNCVLPVHNGDSVNPSYKGDGVIMGVIDYGIDVNHEDFKKSNGDTRIRYLWDQNVALVNPPIPYNYGREWTEFEINAGQCTHDEHVLVSASHGTTVAGIAAGNGRACNGRYVGMAPNTDMIVVAISYQSQFLSHFADAVDYIFKKADAMGKQCVINGSFGAYWGSHDGKDFAAHLIDALLEERSGRVLVCAAGNAGGVPFHLGYEVTSDTSYTWFKYNPAYNDVFFDFWADTQDFNNVYFAIGTDDPSTWNHLDKSSFFNIPNDYVFNIVPPDTTASINFDQKDVNNNYFGSVSTTIFLTEGRYNINVEVSGITNNAHYWSFITTGSGKFDGWNTPLLGVEQSEMVTSLPPQNLRPDIVNYKLPDLTQNMVSSFTCSDKVIAVGNFINRGHYADIDSDIVYTNSIPGKLGPSSSHGPSRDGRIKPDISATGDFTLGSGNAAQTAISSGNADKYKVGYCGKYFRNGGTSMASPAVAGVAALYLQKNPNANWKEVKQALIATAKVDTFTNAVPNNDYGYGKVQACAMILYNAGCMDPTAFNYDSLATFDDGSCIPVIYGCLDSTAFNFNPLANTDDSSCVARILGCTDPTATNYNHTANTDDGSCIGVGVSVMISPNQKVKLEFIPNFFREQSMIVYDLGNNHTGALLITNMLGQTIDEITLNKESGELLYSFPGKDSGIFFYRLLIDKRSLLSGKIVVY